MRPRRSRQTGFRPRLPQLGGMSSPAMLAFGAALVLLLAGVGLVVFALNTRTTARTPSAAGPTPTAFLADSLQEIV